MPPKKDAAVGGDSNELITGFKANECKLIAAAFLSSIGPDKYDYELMATLTGNTSGSLKKMWPTVKKKAIEVHASFGAFLGAAVPGKAAAGELKPARAPKANGNRKRKAADENPDDTNSDEKKDPEPTSAGGNKPDSKSDDNKSEGKTKGRMKAAPAEKAPTAKGKGGRPKKQVKKEEPADEEEDKVENKLESAEDSADGGDGLAGQKIQGEV